MARFSYLARGKKIERAPLVTQKGFQKTEAPMACGTRIDLIVALGVVAAEALGANGMTVAFADMRARPW